MMCYNPYPPPYRCYKPYGFFNFLFDIFMICLTFGFWLIWIFVREMRKQR